MYNEMASCTICTQALHIFSLLADNYWAGLLTPEIIVILFTQAFPTFTVLYYWGHECTKIKLLAINFSRSINKIPGDFQYFQEGFQIPGDFQYFQEL